MIRIKENKHLSIIYIISIILLYITSESNACDSGCRATVSGNPSNIHLSPIVKKWDATWFHYSTETCPLQVQEVWDYDAYTNDGVNWTQVEIDSHNHELCFFVGSGVFDNVSTHSCIFNRASYGPTGPSGTPVNFFADDEENIPSPAWPGETVNDASAVKEIYMHAYEAVVFLNSNSSNSGNQSVGPIPEWGGSNDSITISLAEDEVLVEDDGVTTPIGAWGNATWMLNTNPEEASLSSGGKLQTNIGFQGGSTLYGEVYDNDDYDGEGMSLSVGLTGGSGWGASVSVGISWGSDDCEGQVQGGYDFSSDDIGDTSEAYKFLATSSVLSPDFPYAVWGYDCLVFDFEPTGVFKGTKEATSKAKVVVEAKASVIDDDLLNWAAALAGITGNGKFQVGTPTYGDTVGFSVNPEWED